MADEKNPADDPANPETAAYWRGAAEGKLLYRYCTACNRPHHYPRTLCPICHSTATEWRESAGRGVIYSYSVQRRSNPVRVVAMVTIDEGATMLTNIVDADPDALSVGQAVSVAFRPDPSGRILPMFTPAG